MTPVDCLPMLIITAIVCAGVGGYGGFTLARMVLRALREDIDTRMSVARADAFEEAAVAAAAFGSGDVAEKMRQRAREFTYAAGDDVASHNTGSR